MDNTFDCAEFTVLKKEYEDFCSVLKEKIESEWKTHRFRWFFYKRRRKRIERKIILENMPNLFNQVDEMMEVVYPSVVKGTLDEFTDIKNVARGEKNVFYGGGSK